MDDNVPYILKLLHRSRSSDSSERLGQGFLLERLFEARGCSTHRDLRSVLLIPKREVLRQERPEREESVVCRFETRERVEDEAEGEAFLLTTHRLCRRNAVRPNGLRERISIVVEPKEPIRDSAPRVLKVVPLPFPPSSLLRQSVVDGVVGFHRKVVRSRYVHGCELSRHRRVRYHIPSQLRSPLALSLRGQSSPILLRCTSGSYRNRSAPPSQTKCIASRRESSGERS